MDTSPTAITPQIPGLAHIASIRVPNVEALREKLARWKLAFEVIVGVTKEPCYRGRLEDGTEFFLAVSGAKEDRSAKVEIGGTAVDDLYFVARMLEIGDPLILWRIDTADGAELEWEVVLKEQYGNVVSVLGRFVRETDAKRHMQRWTRIIGVHKTYCELRRMSG